MANDQSNNVVVSGRPRAGSVSHFLHLHPCFLLLSPRSTLLSANTGVFVPRQILIKNPFGQGVNIEIEVRTSVQLLPLLTLPPHR